MVWVGKHNLQVSKLQMLEDICMLSPTSGFALGNRYMDYDFIYHFDGVSWTRITSGLPGNMYRISAIDEEWIWMIDHWGKIIKYNTITEAWVKSYMFMNSGMIQIFK